MGEQRTRGHQTMKPILRGLHSPDVTDVLQPIGPGGSAFCVLVQALIGPEESVGEEAFDFLVCNASWIASHLQTVPFLFGRHYLLVTEFRWNLVEAAIRSLCNDVSGPTWAEVAAKLARYGQWEFEDYRPYEEPGRGGSV
jgi:hypothetical protein